MCPGGPLKISQTSLAILTKHANKVQRPESQQASCMVFKKATHRYYLAITIRLQAQLCDHVNESSAIELNAYSI